MLDGVAVAVKPAALASRPLHKRGKLLWGTDLSKVRAVKNALEPDMIWRIYGVLFLKPLTKTPRPSSREWQDQSRSDGQSSVVCSTLRPPEDVAEVKLVDYDCGTPGQLPSRSLLVKQVQTPLSARTHIHTVLPPSCNTPNYHWTIRVLRIFPFRLREPPPNTTIVSPSQASVRLGVVRLTHDRVLELACRYPALKEHVELTVRAALALRKAEVRSDENEEA